MSVKNPNYIKGDIMSSARGLLTKKNATSSRTVHHHSNPSKKDHANSSVPEDLTPLASDATIEDHIARTPNVGSNDPTLLLSN